MEAVQEWFCQGRQWTEKTQQEVLYALDSAKGSVWEEIRSMMQAPC